VATLIYRYGSWNGALEKFGMEPFDARADVKPFTPPAFNKRLVVFSEEEMLAAIREAAANVKKGAKGAKLGMQDYVIWRKAEIDRSLRETETARRLPAPETIRRYLGSWLRARKLAFEQTDWGEQFAMSRNRSWSLLSETSARHVRRDELRLGR
jgi:hypothetical protein